MAKFGEKPQLNYAALKKELKLGGPQRLYLLWGPEDYLLRDFVNTLRELCLAGGADDFNAKRLDSAAPEAEDVAEAVNAMPFFGERTFVELRGFDVNKCRDERIIKQLEDVPEWCTVAITLPAGVSPDGRLAFVKQLKKDGKAVEFTAQGESALYGWLQKRFAAHGKTVSRDAMDRLMFLSGDLMNRLIPEIDKICAYAKEEAVTVRDVEAVAHHIPEADAFQMTECIASGDYDGAASYLSELLAGDREPTEILGTVGWQMRQLYAARVAMDTGRGPAFAKEVLGIGSDYRLKMLMNTARRFSLRELTNDVRLVAECGARSREQGSAVTDEDSLKDLLVRFAMENRHA